jgi:hypothetical protein
MVKQGGKWVWIADHGGSDPGVKLFRRPSVVAEKDKRLCRNSAQLH